MPAGLMWVALPPTYRDAQLPFDAGRRYTSAPLLVQFYPARPDAIASVKGAYLATLMRSCWSTLTITPPLLPYNHSRSAAIGSVKAAPPPTHLDAQLLVDVGRGGEQLLA